MPTSKKDSRKVRYMTRELVLSAAVRTNKIIEQRKAGCQRHEQAIFGNQNSRKKGNERMRE
jgi:hypothetical protein